MKMVIIGGVTRSGMLTTASGGVGDWEGGRGMETAEINQNQTPD